MKTIAYEDLIIPDDRIRREFAEGPLMELAGSIAEKGLIHAPCLRDDGRTLLAGERRTRAMMHLHSQNREFRYEGQVVPKDHIPYTLASELSHDALLEAELEENVLREKLSWQEHTQAVARLHSLRESQHGKYDRSTGTGWTAKDTASEILGTLALGQQITQVTEATILAKHLDDPEVAKAKDQKTALKIIKKKAIAERNAELAKDFLLSDASHEVINADSTEWIKGVADSSFDVICTDPPYGIGADSFGDQASVTHGYADDFASFDRLMTVMSRELYRVAKPQAHLYLFCDIRNFPYLQTLFAAAKWDVWSTPLIWDKQQQGMLPRPEHGPRRCYEAILYALKGNRTVTSVYSDVIAIPGIQSPRFGAEKPAELYTNLLRRSVRPGDLVLDVFAGCGNIIRSCDDLNCTATVVELNKEKYDHILVTHLAEQDTDDRPALDLNALFGGKN